jgi:N-acetylmuramoyl-L-alanine amidase
MSEVVVVDPGHGGDAAEGSSTPIGVIGPSGALEKDLALDLARRLREALEARGFRVVLTRDGDVNLPLGQRADTSRGEDADVFVSLHLNASRSPVEQGSEVWVHEQATPRSRALAAAVRDAVVDATGLPDRGVRGGPLAVLDPERHGRAAACLAEIAFLTDPAEEARLADEGYRDRIAAAIADAIERFLVGDAGSASISASSRESIDIWHEVPLVPQLTGMSCWAAAAAMIVGWRDCIDIDPEEVARGTGRWEAYRDGLEPEDVDALAGAWGLRSEEPQSYTVDELRRLLERFGPLWVGESSGGLHVVVVSGVYGDGTPGGTFVRVLDPWPEGRGERYTIGFEELARNLAAVSDIAGVRARILHADGRTRGASRSVHYRREFEASYGWDSSGHAERYPSPRYGTPFALFERMRTAPPESFALAERALDDRDWYSDADLADSTTRAIGTRADVRWADDAHSPDYRHLGAPRVERAFAFTADHLARLCELNSFDVGDGKDEVLFGLRGCRLAGPEADFAPSVLLCEDVPDHYGFHCVLGVWRRRAGQLRAFTGSTVPNWRHMERQRAAGGGHIANLLPTV